MTTSPLRRIQSNAPESRMTTRSVRARRATRRAAALALACLIPLGARAACVASISAEAPNGRYTAGSGTVLDTYTGLTWKTCPEGLSGATCATGTIVTGTWADALNRVATVNAAPSTLGAGFSDWRLPNRAELASLIERQCATPAINTTLFPATPSQSFWSSTGYAQIGAVAWAVDFGSGDVGPAVKTGVKNIRLVRGGN